MAMQCTTIAGGNQKNAEDMLGRKERTAMGGVSIPTVLYKFCMGVVYYGKL